MKPLAAVKNILWAFTFKGNHQEQAE